jgi:manganese oxidase
MHLHGFYFTVNAVGDGEHYERYSAEQQPKGVTEMIDPGHVFEMTWTPERAGNWLFHCHMMMHMSAPAALHPQGAQPAAYSEQDHSGGMGGLVIGITMLPGAVPAAAPAVAKVQRKLQLLISENPDKIPHYQLQVNDPVNDAQATADPEKKKPPTLLGPPIVLTRGEETEIEVKNATSSPTAIHWHGIELESFYDGVAGWTGSGRQTTPAIAPGTSFVAHMAPPRAGTFIYHTHWHDQKQLENGVYGPLIVLEPGQKYDPEHDKTFVFGVGRYAPFGSMLIVNGTPEPDPVELKTGTTYRLQLINITTNESDLQVRLEGKDAPTQWKIIASDGADLPAAQLKSSAADMGLTVGSTRDVEFQSDREGYVEMYIAARGFEATIMQPFDIVSAK